MEIKKIILDGVTYEVPAPVYDMCEKLFKECTLAREVIDQGNLAFGPLVPMFAPFVSEDTGIDMMSLMPKIMAIKNDKTLKEKGAKFIIDMEAYRKYRATVTDKA